MLFRSLPKNDPYYGKLALFDKYQFHYTNYRRWELPDILDALKPIRKKWLKELTNNKSFVPIYSDGNSQTFIGLAYYKKTKSNKNNVLLILANGNPYHEVYLKSNIELVRSLSHNGEMSGKLLFSTHEGPRAFTQIIDHNILDIHLGAGEVKIINL